MRGIILRGVDGSKPVVEDIYAFDAYRQSVFVRFAGKGDDLPRPACVQLVELEALDANNRFVPVEQVVRSMTNEVFE